METSVISLLSPSYFAGKGAPIVHYKITVLSFFVQYSFSIHGKRLQPYLLTKADSNLLFKSFFRICFIKNIIPKGQFFSFQAFLDVAVVLVIKIGMSNIISNSTFVC